MFVALRLILWNADVDGRIRSASVVIRLLAQRDAVENEIHFETASFLRGHRSSPFSRRSRSICCVVVFLGHVCARVSLLASRLFTGRHAGALENDSYANVWGAARGTTVTQGFYANNKKKEQQNFSNS